MWYLVVRLKIDGTNKLYFWITFGNGVSVCTSIFKTVNEFCDISWQVSLNIKKQWEIQNFVYLFPNTKLQSFDINLVIVYVFVAFWNMDILYLNIQFYKTTIERFTNNIPCKSTLHISVWNILEINELEITYT